MRSFWRILHFRHAFDSQLELYKTEQSGESAGAAVPDGSFSIDRRDSSAVYTGAFRTDQRCMAGHGGRACRNGAVYSGGLAVPENQTEALYS